MNRKFFHMNNESNKNSDQQSYSANNTSDLNVEELIEHIRDKIQQTLKGKAQNSGRQKR